MGVIRKFVGKYKKALELTLQGKLVQIDWTSGYMTNTELRRWFLKSLNRKINIRGGICLEYRDKGFDLWVDSQILQEWKKWKRKTQWGMRFRTKYFKKRFPHIEEEIEDWYSDYW